MTSLLEVVSADPNFQLTQHADDFERAVLFSFDQTGNVDAALKVRRALLMSSQLFRSSIDCAHVMKQDRAVAYCNQTKAQSLSWQLCLEKYSSTAYMEVRFWCLQTLHEVRSALPSIHQHQSEVLLLLWQLHAVKLHSQLTSVILQVLVTRYEQLDSNVVSVY